MQKKIVSIRNVISAAVKDHKAGNILAVKYVLAATRILRWFNVA